MSQICKCAPRMQMSGRNGKKVFCKSNALSDVLHKLPLVQRIRLEENAIEKGQGGNDVLPLAAQQADIGVRMPRSPGPEVFLNNEIIAFNYGMRPWRTVLQKVCGHSAPEAHLQNIARFGGDGHGH